MEKELINAQSKEVSKKASNRSHPLVIDELNHKKFRTLLKVNFVIFILGLYLPSIGSKKYLFFSDSYSIFTGIFEILLKGNLVLFIIIFSILILMPILNILLLWRTTSLNIPHSSTISIVALFDKLQFIVIGFLVILLAIFELGVFKKLNPSVYIYVYLFSIVSLAFITKKIMAMHEGDYLIDAGKLINSKIDLFKTTALGFMKGFIKISISIIVIAIAFKVIVPIFYKSTTSEDSTNKNISSNTQPQGSSLTGREKDTYNTYNDIDTNNPNFDIGNYCLEKEKRGNLTFEECLGVATLKIFK